MASLVVTLSESQRSSRNHKVSHSSSLVVQFLFFNNYTSLSACVHGDSKKHRAVSSWIQLSFYHAQASISIWISFYHPQVYFAREPPFLTVRIVNTEERNGRWHRVIRECKSFEGRIAALKHMLTPFLEINHRIQTSRGDQKRIWRKHNHYNMVER